MSNQSLQNKYNNFQDKITTYQQKINELSTDEDEHKIVLNTLKSVPQDRKCFKMIGGILLEKTVGETSDILNSNLVNIEKTIENLSTELKKTTETFESWKKDNKIKIIKQ